MVEPKDYTPEMKKIVRIQIKDSAASINKWATAIGEGRIPDKNLAEDMEEAVAHLVSKCILFGQLIEDHVPEVITREQADKYYERWRQVATRSW